LIFKFPAKDFFGKKKNLKTISKISIQKFLMVEKEFVGG